MEFPTDVARDLLTKLIPLYLPGFAGYRNQFSADDLISECMTSALAAWPKYNPAYQPTTFIATVAKRRLMDLQKMAGRRVNYEQRSHEIRPQFTPPPESIENQLDETTPLNEWVRSIYLAAKKAYTSKRYRQGRRFFNIAQAVAIVMLQKRTGYSCREVAELLKQDKSLRNSLHLFRPPGFRWVWLSGQFVEQMGLLEVDTGNGDKKEISQTLRLNPAAA